MCHVIPLFVMRLCICFYVRSCECVMRVCFSRINMDHISSTSVIIIQQMHQRQAEAAKRYRARKRQGLAVRRRTRDEQTALMSKPYIELTDTEKGMVRWYRMRARKLGMSGLVSLSESLFALRALPPPDSAPSPTISITTAPRRPPITYIRWRLVRSNAR